MKTQPFNEITIIGPGLIGSSLGLALRDLKIVKSIVGIDKSKKNLSDAVKIGSIDEGRKIIDSRIEKSELIFLCTPVSTIDELVRVVINFSKKNTIISDVGSVKKIFKPSTIKLASKKCHLVPGHPIAGTEHTGAKFASKQLFQNKWCIITPINKNKKPINIISEIWKNIGMKISIMSQEEHDKIMSITSHLPHLIAFTIVGTAFDINVKKKLFNFSAGGFRDFTRIGSSDPKMWTDIFLKNKKHIIKTLNNFSYDLEKIKSHIIKNEYEKIFNLLKRTKEIRKGILNVEKKIKKN